jgi:hypothetical protein
MKKFMFSTVAMVLFSMSSFGNEAFIEEADLTIRCVDCYQVAANAESTARSLSIYTEEELFAIFEFNYNTCAASGNCCNCL